MEHLMWSFWSYEGGSIYLTLRESVRCNDIRLRVVIVIGKLVSSGSDFVEGIVAVGDRPSL